MPVALATRATRMRHVGADQPRYRHPYSGAACWLVLSGLTMDVPAFDWGTRANLEYRVAGRFAGIHFNHGSESCLRSGGLPAGAQFRYDLADCGEIGRASCRERV